MTTETQLEALLFFKGSAVSKDELAELLNIPRQEIDEALERLETTLTDRGLQLVYKDERVLLTTAQSVAPLIEKIIEEDLQKDLGKAGLETLSIVLYHGPITRSDIDYIRGVNSTYMLRTLLVRGLIERTIHPKDKRRHLYQPTFELLQYLGISRVEELPEYTKVREDIAAFAEHQHEKEENDET